MSQEAGDRASVSQFQLLSITSQLLCVATYEENSQTPRVEGIFGTELQTSPTIHANRANHRIQPASIDGSDKDILRREGGVLSYRDGAGRVQPRSLPAALILKGFAAVASLPQMGALFKRQLGLETGKEALAEGEAVRGHCWASTETRPAASKNGLDAIEREMHMWEEDGFGEWQVGTQVGPRDGNGHIENLTDWAGWTQMARERAKLLLARPNRRESRLTKVVYEPKREYNPKREYEPRRESQQAG